MIPPGLPRERVSTFIKLPSFILNVVFFIISLSKLFEISKSFDKENDKENDIIKDKTRKFYKC